MLVVPNSLFYLLWRVSDAVWECAVCFVSCGRLAGRRADFGLALLPQLLIIADVLYTSKRRFLSALVPLRFDFKSCCFERPQGEPRIENGFCIAAFRQRLLH